MSADWLQAGKQRYRQDTEPERRALAEGGEFRLLLQRRTFLSSLLLVVSAQHGEATPQEIARFQFDDDGTVTLFSGKTELGQGVRTLLAQAAAEELGLAADRVRVVLGDTALVPDDGGTWGSLTTPQTIPVVRKAAALARVELRRGAEGVSKPESWRVLGQSIAPAHGRDVVTGRLKYASDLRAAEGTVEGRVVRAPSAMAKLESFEGKALRDGDFLGVTGATRAEALRALGQVRALWKTETVAPFAEILRQMKESSVPPVAQPAARYPPLIEQGDWKGALARAERRLSAEYRVAYIAHVPLEPRSAIAEWRDGRLTVQSGTQAPFLVRRQLAEAFEIAEQNVRVVSQQLGGGFGGRQTGECEIEAARLAKLAGRVVRLSWSREEEFTCAYARPAGLVDAQSGVTADGRLAAWEFRNYNSGASGLKPPYEIPAMVCAFHRAESPIRQGSYRSLAAVANNFARETHVDEWAAQLKADPLEYRLRNLKDARLKEALERAAERFGWGRRKAGNGHGFGVACNLEKEARLALFAEVEAGARPRVTRLVVAVDPGAVLNPDNLKNQITGGLIQGLGGALFEELRLGPNGIVNGKLSQYRVPRFSDVPEIDVLLIDRREIEPAGAGESPITMPAPAIGNALFAATGVRRRALPLLAAEAGV